MGGSAASRAWPGIAFLAITFGICIALPAGVVIVASVRAMLASGSGPGVDFPGLTTIARTCLYAAAIATLATVLAWPASIAAAGLRPRWLLLAVGPMLMPTYLAYAGWSIARAPTTPIGRFIGEAPARELEWLPVVAGRGLAVWGLALWAWPLAALVLALGFRRVQRSMADPLALEGAGLVARGVMLAGAARSSIGAAWGMVFLLMVGSAVPLHVAQVETYAIRVWTTLDASYDEPWRAWLISWPLILVALTGAWLLATPLARGAERLGAGGGDDDARFRIGRGAIGFAAVPFLLSVVVPFALFAWSMGSVRVLWRFFRDAGGALLSSGGIALAVGGLAGVVCLAVANAARGGSGRLVRVALGVSLAWGLLPGVLVGSAVAQVVRMGVSPDWLADSVAPVAVAHLSRALFVPVLIGVWLSATEARAVRDLRELDGAFGPLRWAQTAMRWHAGPCLIAAAVAAALSFHEIEASVQVQPPGLDHLPQRLLQWLHYERMGELSAAGVLLLGIGTAAAGVVALATGLGRIRTRSGGER